MLQIADRRGPNQFLGGVLRASVGIDDDGALPGKIFQEAGADGLHYLANCPGVIVGRHPDQDVHFSDVDQLAKKIIRKNASFGQTNPPFDVAQSRGTASLRLRSFAGGTSRTGRGPWSTDRADRRCAGKYSCQTSRSEYCLYRGADQAPRPARNWTNCLPPGRCLSRAVAHKPAPGGSPDKGTRSIPGQRAALTSVPL